MHQNDHQQNQAKATMGRDLGQISDLTLSVGDLIEIAKAAHAMPQHSSDSRSRHEHDVAMFFARLVGRVESIAGPSAAGSLAQALGFDHLVEE